MQRSESYSYSLSGAHPPRYSNAHSTSSAFSASANPNEDWTKISDLAERRRIQNRIAQRNYRKKIKRRLEDLERKATSSSPSPEAAPAELPSRQPLKKHDEAAKNQRSRLDQPKRARRQPSDSSSAPYSMQQDDRRNASAHYFKREPSASPPPSLSYSFAPQDQPSPAPYSQHAPFQSSTHYMDYPTQAYYLPTPTGPMPHNSPYELGSVKSEPGFDDEEMLGQFNLGYSSLTGVELPPTQSYQDSNAHTPPLSHSHSFEYSRGGSPSIVFPGTPVSIPDSPRCLIR